jgi:hypothetical protein
MGADNLTHSYYSKAILNTSAKKAFEYLDDPKKLSAHMGKSSMTMAGSKMDMVSDEKQGRQIGSVIKMSGKMMGLKLSLREKIVERVPDVKKFWQTFGEQHLVILEQYKMGFALHEISDERTEVTVSIDYSLPQKGLPRALGKILGPLYAKWCTKQMAKDAANEFLK